MNVNDPCKCVSGPRSACAIHGRDTDADEIALPPPPGVPTDLTPPDPVEAINAAFEGLKQLVTKALQTKADEITRLRASVEADTATLRREIDALKVRVGRLDGGRG